MKISFIRNNKSDLYWLGVLDTCCYLEEQLGYEGALETKMAVWAREALKGSPHEKGSA